MSAPNKEPRPALSDIDAIILCGGLGARLQPVVADKPKALAKVRERAFLDILLDALRIQGLRRFILCVGYLREQIIKHYSARRDAEYVFSEEDHPLGTGGAIHHALPLVHSDSFLVLNGDSFCHIDLARMLAIHCEKRACATVAAASSGARKDGGTLQIDPDGRLLSFEEKAGAGDRMNAGIYLFNRSVLLEWPTEYPYSVERNIFPNLVKAHPCYAFPVTGEVLDIGTPERYEKAQTKFP